MWAVPLTILYGISLAFTRIVVGIGRSTDDTRSDRPSDRRAVRVLSGLDAGGVRDAPDELFDGLSESEALALARGAIDRGDDGAARALLDRFDAARTRERTNPVPGSEGRTGTLGLFEGLRDLATAAADREDDEIGGYVYDLYAVGAALRSKARRVVLVFTAVLAAAFTLLYEGGFGLLSAHFLSRVPAAAQPEGAGLVALHPVEVLLLQMEISTIVAVVAVAPLCAYYA